LREKRKTSISGRDVGQCRKDNNKKNHRETLAEGRGAVLGKNQSASLVGVRRLRGRRLGKPSRAAFPKEPGRNTNLPQKKTVFVNLKGEQKKNPRDP